MSCDNFGLWPFRSMVVPACGRFGLWPFRFVAISVVAVSVCGRFYLLPLTSTMSGWCWRLFMLTQQLPAVLPSSHVWLVLWLWCSKLCSLTNMIFIVQFLHQDITIRTNRDTEERQEEWVSWDDLFLETSVQSNNLVEIHSCVMQKLWSDSGFVATGALTNHDAYQR